jgi:hypothetical protein
VESRGKDTVLQSTEYLYYHLLWVDEFCFVGSNIYDFEKRRFSDSVSFYGFVCDTGNAPSRKILFTIEQTPVPVRIPVARTCAHWHKAHLGGGNVTIHWWNQSKVVVGGIPSVTIMVRLSLQTTVLLTVVYHVSATTMAGVPAISNVPKAQGKKRFCFKQGK